MTAFEGDTIGSALHAGGRRVLSRSFKYHRPRGLLCCAGQCPNCLVEVDGWPGVRACTEPVREGMRVAHMNASPSLRFDLMRGTDLFGSRLTPPGFYYKTFIRPRRLWPLYEKVLRHAAGLGRLRRRQAEREWRTEYRRRHADVLVLGGGVAGMAAALRAAELGADVVLVDDGPELGGALLAGDGAEAARAMAARVRAAGVEVLAPAAALGFFDGIVPVWCQSTLHQIRADQHVAATGSIEQPLMFEGNDLPGVMLCSGAQRLASLYGVRPGRAALVATVADRGLEAALALHEAGVEVVGIADARPSGADEELVARIAEARIPLLRGAPWFAPSAVGRSRERSSPSSTRAAGRSETASARSTAISSPSRAAPSPPPRCCCRPAPRPAGTRPAAPTSRTKSRRASMRRARSRATSRGGRAEISGAVGGGRGRARPGARRRAATESGFGSSARP